MISHSFSRIYLNKRVLITGHTGFKGSWLSTWLIELGAIVAGYSIDLPSNPSNFEALNLETRIRHIKGDVCNFAQLKQAFDDFQPEIVFHAAAQAITRLSYDMPKKTFYTNVGGTVNVLECIRMSGSVKAAVIITSDKCYQNVEWIWGYRETDALGGDDPYSASKACAEIACHSYMKSFFSKESPPRIATSRAGNVIGGGDWAADRIVPDFVRAFSKREQLEIRNPSSTRPWQLVLEPLSGYLWLGANLFQNNNKVTSESFNFGPLNSISITVEELIGEISKTWGAGNWHTVNSPKSDKKESSLLKLNCDKALHFLNWHTALSFEETARMTSNWYKAFYTYKEDMYIFSVKQINDYTYLAHKRGLAWASEYDK